MTARIMLHSIDDFFHIHGLTIGTDGRQRIEDICDSDDLSKERDLVPRQTIRIACPIDVFVMLCKCRKFLTQLANISHDIRSDGGMFPHLINFIRGQVSRFAQDGIGDADFADIVQ